MSARAEDDWVPVLVSDRKLDRSVAESRDRFGRDYLSASYGTEIPPDNLEELMKTGEPPVDEEHGRIVLLASAASFKAEMDAVRSRRSQRAASVIG